MTEYTRFYISISINMAVSSSPCNTSTNIFCITDWPQFDPEAAGTMNGTNIVNGLEMGALPMTRTYGFNIKLSF